MLEIFPQSGPQSLQKQHKAIEGRATPVTSVRFHRVAELWRSYEIGEVDGRRS